jgi:hypothetical protein
MIRFKEKWAEYACGAGPLQLMVLGKISLPSKEAIEIKKERVVS